MGFSGPTSFPWDGGNEPIPAWSGKGKGNIEKNMILSHSSSGSWHARNAHSMPGFLHHLSRSALPDLLKLPMESILWSSLVYWQSWGLEKLGNLPDTVRQGKDWDQVLVTLTTWGRVGGVSFGWPARMVVDLLSWLWTLCRCNHINILESGLFASSMLWAAIVFFCVII